MDRNNLDKQYAEKVDTHNVRDYRLRDLTDTAHSFGQNAEKWSESANAKGTALAHESAASKNRKASEEHLAAANAYKQAGYNDQADAHMKLAGHFAGQKDEHNDRVEELKAGNARKDADAEFETQQQNIGNKRKDADAMLETRLSGEHQSLFDAADNLADELDNKHVAPVIADHIRDAVTDEEPAEVAKHVKDGIKAVYQTDIKIDKSHLDAAKDAQAELDKYNDKTKSEEPAPVRPAKPTDLYNYESEKAEQATAKAEKSGLDIDHTKAEKLHRQAAHVSGDEDGVGAHEDYHNAMAKYHHDLVSAKSEEPMEKLARVSRNHNGNLYSAIVTRKDGTPVSDKAEAAKAARALTGDSRVQIDDAENGGHSVYLKDDQVRKAHDEGELHHEAGGFVMDVDPGDAELPKHLAKNRPSPAASTADKASKASDAAWKASSAARKSSSLDNPKAGAVEKAGLHDKAADAHLEAAKAWELNRTQAHSAQEAETPFRQKNQHVAMANQHLREAANVQTGKKGGRFVITKDLKKHYVKDE